MPRPVQNRDGTGQFLPGKLIPATGPQLVRYRIGRERPLRTPPRPKYSSCRLPVLDSSGIPQPRRGRPFGSRTVKRAFPERKAEILPPRRSLVPPRNAVHPAVHQGGSVPVVASALSLSMDDADRIVVLGMDVDRMTSPYFSNTSEDQRKEECTTMVRTGHLAALCLDSAFYSQPCHMLAKALLGKILVRQLDDGTLIKGKIVETEAYPGETDRASHTFKGKTKRNAAMFAEAGTAYVYFVYGMYDCFNISALEPGAGVLIRAIEPVDGVEAIRKMRKNGERVKLLELCNGPGRLCQAFNITTAVFNGHDLTEKRGLWLEEAEQPSFAVVEAPRIGIDSYGAEWAAKPWRYYILGNRYVSKRHKISEAVFLPEPGNVGHISLESAVQSSSRKRKERGE